MKSTGRLGQGFGLGDGEEPDEFWKLRVQDQLNTKSGMGSGLDGRVSGGAICRSDVCWPTE